MRLIGVLLFASCAAMTLPAAAENAKPAEPIATLEEQVRAAERAFAKTMADRDHAAFAKFIAEDAVFWGRTPLRGKAAIADGWKKLYEGPKAPFSWEPERVAVIASGGLAISSGPVYDPDGKRSGTFNSTWRREANGEWKVVLDLGCPPCDCGKAEAPPQPQPSPKQ